MRKASRQMDGIFALEVLDKAPYVTVSMTRPDGTPYGLPLSLVRTDDKTFYFHCAPSVRLLSVRKMEALHYSISQRLPLVRLRL